jgi:hypothetical protein
MIGVSDMREEELQAVLKKAKVDASFFEQLFSEPEKALANAGLSPELTKEARSGCATLTCGWSCQYTGSKSAKVSDGKVDCGLTCEWSCGWTAGVNSVGMKADAGLKTENCEVTCSYTVHRNNELEQVRGKFEPDACTMTCSDTCGATCGITRMMKD